MSRCPSCASVGCEVIDSRVTEGGLVTRRRRRCLACGARFTTYEGLGAAATETRTVARRIAQQLRTMAATLEQ
jgi:transcriptional repressor NrdR